MDGQLSDRWMSGYYSLKHTLQNMWRVAEYSEIIGDGKLFILFNTQHRPWNRPK